MLYCLQSNLRVKDRNTLSFAILFKGKGHVMFYCSQFNCNANTSLNVADVLVDKGDKSKVSGRNAMYFDGAGKRLLQG